MSPGCTLVMRVIDITSQTLPREQALGQRGLKENAQDFFFCVCSLENISVITLTEF